MRRLLYTHLRTMCKKKGSMSIVVVKSVEWKSPIYECISATLFCKVVFVAEHMQDTIAKPFKIAVSVSITLEDLDFVVTAFGKIV